MSEEKITLKGRYDVECRDKDGNILWREVIDNLVVTVGKNNLLDNYLAGSAYTAAFFMGLVDGGSAPTYAAADTMASHAGWTENTGYSNATRPAPSFSSASAGSKTTSAAVVFNINATGTIAGCFITTNSTVGGTTGTLFSAGSFSGGNQPVVNTNTLSVTYTLSV